ncbi:MAG: Ppx/GppA family phosphatase [Novosphingobium sp.]
MLLQCPPEERRRAIIDIGSNSIRLVVYPSERRVPAELINEKVAARLGRTLQDDGRMPGKAMDIALAGLARFAAIVEGVGVESLSVVATAAVRDASNGPAFLDQVRALGLEPTLLSGGEEAAASALGVLCAFPDADGVVADLGGGSLELVEVAEGKPGRGVTLPLGTLRLARMREKSTTRALQKMRALIEAGSPPGLGQVRPLYVVGGSWRALAQFAMHEIRWPIRSTHGFVIEPRQVAHLVSVLSHTPAANLKHAGVSGARIDSIVDAALVLAALVRHLRPSQVIVSSFGLREGLAFGAMPPEVRRREPFLADLEDQLGAAGSGSIYGAPLHRWGRGAFPGESAADSRLRYAASWLGLAVRRAEAPVRAERALEVTLHEKWVGVGATDRARIAAALLAFVGEKRLPPELPRLCAPAQLERAAHWGCLMRLGLKLSAGVATLLDSTALRVADGRLELVLPRGRALYSEAAQNQHASLAGALGLTPAVRER